MARVSQTDLFFVIREINIAIFLASATLATHDRQYYIRSFSFFPLGEVSANATLLNFRYAKIVQYDGPK